MTDDNRGAERFRRTMELLAEADGQRTRSDLWEQVTAELPLTEREAAETASGRARGAADWIWRSVNLVKAGWLVKNGRGGWEITPDGRAALAEHPDAEGFNQAAVEGYYAWQSARDEERTRMLAHGIVPADDDQEKIVATARLFVERGLRDLDSVFAPGRRVWRSEVTRELIDRFVASDGSVGSNFVEKVAHQLADASDDARLLMAELVALQLLPASTDGIGEVKKAERVQSVLDLMTHPVQIPEDIRSAFAAGSFNPGQAMASNLGGAMAVVVEFAHAWVSLDDEERGALLEDPWAFRSFANSTPGPAFRSQRLSLMYLVHPGTFTSIVQQEAREKIRAAFIGETGREPGDDLDRDLRDIWVALQVKHKRRIHFWMPEFLGIWAGERSADIPPEGGGDDDELTHAALEFPEATEALADELLMPRPWLQEALDVIRRRRQVILYGPPGTGKTFVAKALARFAAGGSAPTIVQFHPSYSYEDFVAGYRPHSEGGALTYRLKRGPLLRVAEAAARNPESPHFLVIDEINRGNLAKVFGELYFLLEYREEAIRLLYEPDDAPFALPANVFLIGTMNTADRSIALMDAAMRRRFAFLELHPDESPTRDLLDAWLARHGLPSEPADLLRALNSSIHDRDARIGPSFLMSADRDVSDARLEQIWKYEILPLVEETHYGDNRDIDREFGLAALRRRVRHPDLVEDAAPIRDADDADAAGA